MRITLDIDYVTRHDIGVAIRHLAKNGVGPLADPIIHDQVARLNAIRDAFDAQDVRENYARTTLGVAALCARMVRSARSLERALMDDTHELWQLDTYERTFATPTTRREARWGSNETGFAPSGIHNRIRKETAPWR